MTSNAVETCTLVDGTIVVGTRVFHNAYRQTVKPRSFATRTAAQHRIDELQAVGIACEIWQCKAHKRLFFIRIS